MENKLNLLRDGCCWHFPINFGSYGNSEYIYKGEENKIC